MRASLLALPLTELATVVALVWVDLWLPPDGVWTHAAIRALAAAVVTASFFRRRAVLLAEPKMRPRRAWLEAAGVTLALGAIVLAWALAIREPFDEFDVSLLAGGLPALGPWLLRRVALVSVQQLGLQLFLFPVARELLRSGALATFAVAALFGVFHLQRYVMY